MDEIEELHTVVRDARDQAQMNINQVEDQDGKALCQRAYDTLAYLETAFDEYIDQHQ